MSCSTWISEKGHHPPQNESDETAERNGGERERASKQTGEPTRFVDRAYNSHSLQPIRCEGIFTPKSFRFVDRQCTLRQWNDDPLWNTVITGGAIVDCGTNDFSGGRTFHRFETSGKGCRIHWDLLVRREKRIKVGKKRHQILQEVPKCPRPRRRRRRRQCGTDRAKEAPPKKKRKKGKEWAHGRVLYGESEQQSFLGNVTSHTSDCCGRFPTRLWVEVGRASVLEVTPSAVRCSSGVIEPTPALRGWRSWRWGVPNPVETRSNFPTKTPARAAPRKRANLPSAVVCDSVCCVEPRICCAVATRKREEGKVLLAGLRFSPRKKKTERRNIWQVSSIDWKTKERRKKHERTDDDGVATALLLLRVYPVRSSASRKTRRSKIYITLPFFRVWACVCVCGKILIILSRVRIMFVFFGCARRKIVILRKQ